jgi:hypothetical protein
LSGEWLARYRRVRAAWRVSPPSLGPVTADVGSFFQALILNVDAAHDL